MGSGLFVSNYCGGNNDYQMLQYWSTMADYHQTAMTWNATTVTPTATGYTIVGLNASCVICYATLCNAPPGYTTVYDSNNNDRLTAHLIAIVVPLLWIHNQS